MRTIRHSKTLPPLPKVWRGVLTTNQAATVAYCSFQSISKAFDAGELRGFVAGRRHRRIPPAELRRWMVAAGIPTDRLDRFLALVGETPAAVAVEVAGCDEAA